MNPQTQQLYPLTGQRPLAKTSTTPQKHKTTVLLVVLDAQSAPWLMMPWALLGLVTVHFFTTGHNTTPEKSS